MQTETIFFKILPILVYFIAFILSCLAGTLVYIGLSSREERIQSRLRLKRNFLSNKDKFVENASKSKAEEWFKKAQYPLGLNGLRFYLIYWGILIFLILYYVFVPLLFHTATKSTMLAMLIITLIGILGTPGFRYSLFTFFMKKVISYHQAKKNAEVFMLYDLLINEIEMMTNRRINTYSVLRDIKPYFTVLDKPLTMLLASWGNDEGPTIALEKFSKELNSKEADALVGVIKNLDNMDRKTVLNQLRGMHNMFIRSQIENYRRRRKITTDLLSLPIKSTHFIIILNLILVIITMVAAILESSNM